MVAHEAVGDNTGRFTARPAQVYFNTQSRVLQEYSFLVQQMAGIALPQVVNCRGVDVVIKGKYSRTSVAPTLMAPLPPQFRTHS